jgi:hypothetical protein
MASQDASNGLGTSATNAELLGDQELATMLRKNPQHEGQILSCLRSLAADPLAGPDASLQAKKKAIEAITGKLRVFISYKRESHAEVALDLQETLLAFGSLKMDVFLDAVNIEAGKDWYDSIRKGLRSANCLILLVPDHSGEREWPIFEAGYFAGGMLAGERLICLHHPKVEIPRPLAAFQGHKATAGEIEKMLCELLVDPGVVPGLPAINPNCRKSLSERAKKLAEEFSAPTHFTARVTMNFVKLELGKPGHLRTTEDLLDCVVIDSRGLSEMFFYTGRLPAPLAKVLDVTANDMRGHDVWLTELTDSIRDEIDHRRGEVPFARFSTPDRKQFYRPLLQEVEEDENGVVHRMEIVFGEHLSGANNDPDDLQVMEAGLRLAARLRGEILGPLRSAKGPEDVARAERILKRIEREAYDAGFRNRRMLIRLFSPVEQKRIDRMYDDWTKYRNEEHTGLLDRAFAQRDCDLLRVALAEVETMNRMFTISAAERYVELLKEGAGTVGVLGPPVRARREERRRTDGGAAGGVSAKGKPKR